jgi:hypothetical protein
MPSHLPPKRDLAPFFIPLPSPSIHEGALGDVDASDGPRSFCQEALRALRLAAEKSRVATLAVHGDLTRSNGAQHVDAHRASYQISHQVLPLVDRAAETLRTAINGLKMKTQGPAEDVSVRGNMQAAELRQLLAGMTQQARLAAISKSLAEGDDSLAAAALHASRFLTGLSEIEQQHVRMQWAEKRRPAELKRIKQLESDLVHLERAGKLLIAFQQKCADQNIVLAAQKSRAAADAAVKAAGLN